ncbi:MAG: response regulator [Nitrospirae bacterium]|nr:response regulator [Magnetococcales bacterium]HAT51348.1 hypothetical protein [Alphaproteobacteria bacterium]
MRNITTKYSKIVSKIPMIMQLAVVSSIILVITVSFNLQWLKNMEKDYHNQELGYRLEGRSLGILEKSADVLASQIKKHETHILHLQLLFTGFLLSYSLLIGGAVYWLAVRPVKRVYRRLREIHQTKGQLPAKEMFGCLEIFHLSLAVNHVGELIQLLNDSQGRFRNLFEHMMVAAIVLKPQGNDFKIIDINHAGESLNHLEKSQCLGRLLKDFFPNIESTPVWPALKATLSEVWSQSVGPYSCADGRTKGWCESQIYRLSSGELVWMENDISDRLQTETLRREKDAAVQANAMKSNFLATMSHEIRTPINGMLGMIELLRTSGFKGNQKRWIEGLRDSGEILLTTINDILDFSKIEAGGMKIENAPFSLDPLIKNLINTTVTRAYEKNLEFVIYKDRTVPDQIVGDSFRLQQVLSNLISNAIKFTPAGEISLTMTASESSDIIPTIYFSVRDSGIGIANDHIARIFTAFDQGDAATSRMFGGTGLGLTICKKLVEAMDGTIEVESLLGTGSTFRVSLPWKRLAGKHPETPSMKQTIHALCALNNATARDTLVRTLNDMNFIAYSYSDEISLLDAMDEWKANVNIVFLDCNLYGSDMISLTQKLRSQPGLAHLPVVYLINTYDQNRGTSQLLENVPYSAMIIKPVYGSLIWDVVMDLLEGKRSYAGKKWGLKRNWKEIAKKLRARELLGGGQILLVEDNEINRMVALEALSLAGLKTHIAINGVEALNILEQQQMDGVLMDVQMPVLDGLQTTQIIRNRLELTHLPIIAMTAGVQGEEKEKCLHAGMNDYIGKPLDYETLLKKLIAWVHPVRDEQSSACEPKQTSCLEEPVLKEKYFPSELPGIDIDVGLALLGNNIKLYRKLLKSFHDAHALSGLHLVAALNSGDRHQAIRLAHTLKGIAGTLGANDLRSHAIKLEELFMKNNNPDVGEHELLSRLLCSLEQVMGGIRAIKNPQAIIKSSHDHPNADKIIGRLQELLHRGDTRSIRIFHKHKENISKILSQDVVETMTDQLNRYDMKRAAEILASSMHRIENNKPDYDS